MTGKIHTHNTLSNGMVSVIVPCYNYAHFLPATLDALIAQTYQNWECLIIDDGSSDATAAVAKSYVDKDQRFRYIHQNNQGLSAARNTGIRASKGVYIQLLDADDLIEHQKLEKQVYLLDNHSSVDIVYSNMQYFDSENINNRRLCMWMNAEDDGPWMPMVSGRGGLILSTLIEGNIMVVNAPLLRKSVVEEIGFFSEHLSSYEDWDYWFRCALAGKYFQYLNEPNTLALVRMHPASMSTNSWNMSYNALLVRKKMQTKLDDPVFKEVNKYLMQQNLMDLARLSGRNLSEDRELAKERLQKLIGQTGLLKFRLLKWYAGFLSDRNYSRMVSLHFQSLLTTINHQFKKS